jgi:hypothetical protein
MGGCWQNLMKVDEFFETLLQIVDIQDGGCCRLVF